MGMHICRSCKLNITVAAEMKFRDYQEDQILVKELKTGETILGIFDGHGGPWVAKFASKYTPYIVRSTLRVSDNYMDLMFKVIERLNHKTEYMYSGSTTSIVLIDENKTTAYIAILGDSPVIIKDANGNIWRSPEHNINTNKNEVMATKLIDGTIINNGYLFDRYMGMNSCGIQMTRSLGDKDLRRVLNRTPEIFEIPINKDSWILLCSDGLINMEPMANSFNDILNKIENQLTLIASDLVTCKNNGDNSSAILVKF